MYEREVDVPRLVARAPARGVGSGVLQELSRVLSHRYEVRLDSISLALYRNGDDSVAPHGDKMGPLRQDTVIAIVSLGAPRRFNLRAVDGSVRASFALGAGDLLVMGGSCQETFLHGVPKVRWAEPRMSIQFRQTLPEAVAKAWPESLTASRPVRLGS